MNILFIHEIDWLKKVVIDTHTMAECMSVLGHKVYAIDYESMWSKNGIFDVYSPKKIVNISRVYPGTSVSLMRPGFVKIPILSRISAFFSHYFQIEKMIREKKIDIIILYSVPTNGLQTIYLARKFRIPVVFRALDILNQLVQYPILRYPTHILERKVYSRVDLVLTLSPKLSEYVINLGAPENKVGLLPLGVDTLQFRPSVDCSDLRKKWKIKEEEPVILFLGTLYDFSGLDIFLNYFSLIKSGVPKAKLLIVGDGPQRARLEQIIKQMGFDGEVIITGFQPFSSMPAYINMATVGINPFVITGATSNIFPGKIIQYLACGKVIVATPLPGMQAVLPQDDCGVVFAHNGEDMAMKVINLLRSPDCRHLLEEKGIIYVQNNHSYDKIGHQLEAILDETVRSKHGR